MQEEQEFTRIVNTILRRKGISTVENGREYAEAHFPPKKVLEINRLAGECVAIRLDMEMLLLD